MTGYFSNLEQHDITECLLIHFYWRKVHTHSKSKRDSISSTVTVTTQNEQDADAVLLASDPFMGRDEVPHFMSVNSRDVLVTPTVALQPGLLTGTPVLSVWRPLS